MALDSDEVLKKMFSFSLFAVVTEVWCHCREASQLASVGVCWRRLKVKATTAVSWNICEDSCYSEGND